MAAVAWCLWICLADGAGDCADSACRLWGVVVMAVLRPVLMVTLCNQLTVMRDRCGSAHGPGPHGVNP